MITTVLFDLDGTLTDPGTGITKSLQYALRHYGIEQKLEELKKYIGPPLKYSFMEYASFTEDRAVEAVDKYREYFSEKGMYENEVYEGIPELLDDLKSADFTLAVATSKPGFFAEKILRHFDLDQYFDETVGSNMDNTRTDKKEIIDYALELLGKKPEEALMVGDRKHDIIGAKANGLHSIAVLYGYGSREEMELIKPDYIAEDIQKLSERLKNINNTGLQTKPMW